MTSKEEEFTHKLVADRVYRSVEEFKNLQRDWKNTEADFVSAGGKPYKNTYIYYSRFFTPRSLYFEDCNVFVPANSHFLTIIDDDDNTGVVLGLHL